MVVIESGTVYTQSISQGLMPLEIGFEESGEVRKSPWTKRVGGSNQAVVPC